MKKLLYLLLMLFVASCSKDIEPSTLEPVEGEPMQFRVNDISRVSYKTAWTIGDKIAIFSKDSNGVISASKCYEIEDTTECTLKPTDATDQYTATDGVEYFAVYPYAEGKSYETYKSLFVDFADIDYIISDFSESSQLSFKHVFAAVSVWFESKSVEYALAETDVLNITMTIGDRATKTTTAPWNNGNHIFSSFVLPVDATLLQKVRIFFSVNDDDTIYTIPTLTFGSVNSWESGNIYKYCDVYVGTKPIED